MDGKRDWRESNWKEAKGGQGKEFGDSGKSKSHLWVIWKHNTVESS